TLAAAATAEDEGRAPDTVEVKRSEGLRRERAVSSKQFRDGTFHNTSGAGDTLRPESADGKRYGTGWMLREWMFGGQERRPKVELTLDRPHDAWTRPSTTGQRVTWLGHSTVLLELDGRRILTDPVFANRICPTRFTGPRR